MNPHLKTENKPPLNAANPKQKPSFDVNQQRQFNRLLNALKKQETDCFEGLSQEANGHTFLTALNPSFDGTQSASPATTDGLALKTLAGVEKTASHESSALLDAPSVQNQEGKYQFEFLNHALLSHVHFISKPEQTLEINLGLMHSNPEALCIELQQHMKHQLPRPTRVKSNQKNGDYFLKEEHE
jgi:hypothetical protein